MNITHAEFSAAQRLAPDYADFLIGCIELAVKHIADPRERLARQVGMLQSEVRRLSAEVDALRRDEVATEEQS